MKWINKFLQLPLFIKLPFYLAIVLLLSLLLTILLLDQGQIYRPEKNVHSCYIQKSGKMIDQSEQLKFISHLYLNENGEITISGLKKNNSEWVSSAIYLDRNHNIKFKEIKRTENGLTFLGENNFLLLDTMNQKSIIKVADTGRVFMSEIDKTKGIVHYTNLGLCGDPWPDAVQYRFANDKYIIAWDQKGRVGFYPMSQMKKNIPREVPQSPEFLFLAQDPNHLVRLSCSELKESKTSFIHFNQGILSYSTSPYQNIVQYKVHSNLLEFEMPASPIKRSHQGPFFILDNNLILEEASSKWTWRPHWQLGNEIIPGHPILSKTTQDEGFQHWLLSYQQNFFSEQYYMFYWDQDKVKYHLPTDLAKIKIKSQYWHWLTLPEQEHFMMSSQLDDDHSQSHYIQLKCPKIRKDTEVL